MKKPLLFILCSLLPLAAVSQKQTIPEEGKFMIELNMTPFGDEQVFEFDRFMGKYFITDRLVARLGVDLKWDKNQVKESDYRPEDELKNTYKEKSVLFGLAPGIEYRILKSTKISPYVGAEISFAKLSSSSQYDTYSESGYQYDPITGDYVYKYKKTRHEIDNAWKKTGSYLTNGYYGPMTMNYTYYDPVAYTSWGLNLILGADFYLVPNMYFGLEAGLGYHSYKYKMVTVKSTAYDTSEVPGAVTESTVMASRKSSEMKFYSNAAIRFGVWF